MSLSIYFCLVTLKPIRAGRMMSLTFDTALETPFPRKRVLSLSLSYKASYFPVEAPEGTAALNTPNNV